MSIRKAEAANGQLPASEVTELMRRLAEHRPQDGTRLGRECARLDPAAEQGMADEGTGRTTRA